MNNAATNKNYEKLLRDYDKHCQYIANVANIELHETVEEKHNRVKSLEADYVTWFEYYFSNYAKSKCAWFHKKMANLIIKNKQINLLAEIYRSGAKSVHVDMGIPLYLMFTGELKFMLLIGETDIKAKKLLSGIQAQLQYNKRIINDYGAKFQYGDWAEGDFTTTDGVKFMSLGFGQSPRGVREGEWRPDYIVVDDVDNKKHVNNDRLMRESVDYITEDIWGCFDAEDNATQRFVFANNNFHKNSITNRLKIYFQSSSNAAKAEGNKSVHHVLTVRAVKDLINFIPEWPEKTSSEFWKKKFKNTPYRSFMREYMHVHIQDGSVYRFEDMQWKKMYNYKDYESLVVYSDLSYKAHADYKGMYLIGKKGREIHIIHSFLRHCTRPAVAEWLYNLYEAKKLEKANILYMIEGLFAMDEFVSDFDHEGDKRGYYIPVTPDKRGKADKYDRIEAMAGYFERHDVFFNEDERELADQITTIDQFLAFEKGSKANDDGPDAIQGGISKLNRYTHIQNFEPRLGFRKNEKGW